jgi:hypothetical protein
MRKVLQARDDPVFFCEDEYFLGLTLWPLEKDIIRRFIWGVPKEMKIEDWMTAKAEYLKNNNIEEFQKTYVQEYFDLVIEAGMNSGKTFLASCLGLQQAFELLTIDDPVHFYGAGAGTEFFILNVATSDEQAHDTVFAQEKGKIDNSPFFQWMKPRERYNEYNFEEKHVIVRCGGSNSSSLVGRAVKCALFDELARFQTTSGERGAYSVYNGLGRGTKKVPKLRAKRIAISSMLYEKDIIDSLYEMSKRVKTMLGYKYATWEMNPELTMEVLADEFEKDAATAWRDYGNQPARDIQKYYGDTEIVEFNKDRSSPLLSDNTFKDWFMGDAEYDYIMTGDPAIKFDSFGIALGHLNRDNVVVVDFIHKISPKLEVDPAEVVYYIDVLKSRFNITKFIIDQWNYPETLKKIQEKGIEIVFNTVGLKEHDKLKEAWKLKQIDCYDSPELFSELANLEIHQGKKIDHPRKGSKDEADALAQLVFALTATTPAEEAWSPSYYRRIIADGPLVMFGRTIGR